MKNSKSTTPKNMKRVEGKHIIGFKPYGAVSLKVVCLTCGWWHACISESIGKKLFKEHLLEVNNK